MIGTIWNNGDYNQSGAGYGIKIKELDRDKFFSREWQSVFLKLEGQNDKIEVNIGKLSFWGIVCRELIKKEIGLWLIKNNQGTWDKGHPPTVKLEPTGKQQFNVTLI